MILLSTVLHNITDGEQCLLLLSGTKVKESLQGLSHQAERGTPALLDDAPRVQQNPGSVAGGEDFEGTQCGRGAVFGSELFIDVFQMLFRRGRADVEDGPNFRIGFALGHPEEDFRLARRQPEGFQRSRRFKLRPEFCPVLAPPLEARANGAQQFINANGFGEIIVRAEVHSGAHISPFSFRG